MKNYSITKYKGNTHYSVNVTDSYGREKSNFFVTKEECWKFIYKVWDEEVPLSKQEKQENLLNNAIANCIEIDLEHGVEPKLD